jgi:flagellar biosynthesis/type III secretory pathway protein FliH
MILLNADVREAAAKMFAEPVRDGVAEGVEAGAVDLVAFPQAAANSAKQATATMYRVLPGIFKCSPPHV